MATCVSKVLGRRVCFGLLLLAGGLGFGCASQSEETKRQLESLNERILILQNDRDRLVERVDALEKHHGPVAQMSPATTTSTRPALKVVHLTPETAEPSTNEPSSPDATSTEASPDSKTDPAVNVESPNEHTSVPTDPAQRVVLYGEGQVSGVREPAAGQESP